MPEERKIKFELTWLDVERLNTCLEDYIGDLEDDIRKQRARYQDTKDEKWLKLIPLFERDREHMRRIKKIFSGIEHVK